MPLPELVGPADRKAAQCLPSEDPGVTEQRVRWFKAVSAKQCAVAVCVTPGYPDVVRVARQ